MAGRIILITGVTRGLGRAMAAEFIRLGHTVLGCGRTKNDVQQLRRQFERPHDFCVVDVSSAQQVKSWAARVLKSHGPPNVVRHFVPAMVELKSGVIVNFSSGWGRSTNAEVAPYCDSKWGIEGVTQALAQELPTGMAAVALNPGIINTEMLQSCFGGSASGYASPSEWAKTAVPFLLKIG